MLEKPKTEIVTVSLFDGASIGRVALDRVSDIKVLRYYSSEIDKYAIQIANKNFPQDEKYRLGDVSKIDGYKLLKEIKKDFGDDVKIFLIGGSPCQGFSMAGKRKGSVTSDGIEVTTLEQYLRLKKEGFSFDGQSYLFWEYKRIQNEINPNWFLLENVAVSKRWLPMFNTAMGYDEFYFNSDIVSAQSRPRFYWTNLKIVLPENKRILFDDILEQIEPTMPLTKFMTGEYSGKSRLEKGIFNFYGNTKSRCVSTGSSHGNKYIIKLGKSKKVKKTHLTLFEDMETINVSDDSLNEHVYRKITPLECERLQTLPDDYTETEGVSDTQRFKMLGNCFTADVIVEFLKALDKAETKVFQRSFDF